MSTTIGYSRPAEILLVEDNADDVELTKIGCQQSHYTINLHHVGNGEECMAYLRKEGKYRGVPMPDIILLDLNMPRMDGREVLEEIARDERIRHVPIVVLTTSEAEADILRSYQLHCCSYIVKPVAFENFAKGIQMLSDYWFSLVSLPSTAHSLTHR